MSKIIKKVSFLLLLVVSINVYAQQMTITGTVTDKDGTLPGVNILVKGTALGVVTDNNGKYTITVPNANAVLVFSFIGYTTQEIQVDSQRSIDVVLAEDAATLEEVVVVGYGTQRKSDVTGSVVSVKGTELNTLPNMRPDAALQGRASGVMIQNTDGAPGGNVYIRVRGGNSILGGNNALVVVDGLQGADLTLINPNDIESLEVLKDASATAVYGARGANGVILITTKRGSSGKPVFQYDYSIGFQKISRKLDLFDAAEYARDRNAWRAASDSREGFPHPATLFFTDDDIRRFEKGDPQDCTDWQEVLYRTGLLQKHQISVNGGSDKIKYFISGGYMNQEGILITTNYQRYNLRSNLDINLTNWLDAGINLNMMKSEGNVPPVGEGTRYGDITGQVVNLIPRFDPCTPIYDENGNYNFYSLQGRIPGSGIYSDNVVWNPMASIKEMYNQNNQYRQEANLYLDFKILEGLTFRISGVASINNNNQVRYYSTKTMPGSSNSGSGNTDYSNDQYYQNSNILSYNRIFGDHRLQVVAVGEQQLSLSKSVSVSASGFFSDDTGIKDLQSASLISGRSTGYSKRAINSWLGRINYTYKDRYMLTASIRRDGSSVFGDNNKYGNFPSASVAWNIAEEDFLKGVDFLSMMKFRASWGQTGNQAISAYQTMATVSSMAGYPYLGTGARQTGYQLGRLANPALKWETTAQTNLGVDMGFFNQRLTVTVDIYKKTTTDLLLNQNMPTYTGFGSVISNVGSIENKGLEISFSGTPIAKKDILWTSEFNLTFNRDKCIKLANRNAEGYAPPLTISLSLGGGYGLSDLKKIKEGESIEAMWGFISLPCWSTADAEEARRYGKMPGDERILDVFHRDNPNEPLRANLTTALDGDQKIGNANPQYYFGWNNNIRWKFLNLAFLIQGSYGNDIMNATLQRLQDVSNGGRSRTLLNRWTPNNQNTYIPGRPYMSGYERGLAALPADRMNVTDMRRSRWVEDGSYVRLKHVTLSAFVPQEWINVLPITKLAFYVSATNLITITNYSGYDPEVSSFNVVGAGALGIDHSNYPSSRVFSLGINVTF